MTDELELLLDEDPEEEVVELSPIWADDMNLPRKEGSQDAKKAVWSEADRSGPAVWKIDEVLQEQGMPVEQDVSEEGEMPPEGGSRLFRKGLRDVTTRLLRRENSGERSAGEVYRMLTRSRQAAGYQRPGGRERIPLLREETPVGGESDILRLDRAFQRDARRYDGGFTWR